MNLGKILDESSFDYHANEAISHSKLETFRKRPLLFKKRYIDKVLAPESSAAFTLGSATHCAILEPTEYAHRYVIAPEVDRRTKAGKDEWAAFQAANVGKELISREDGMVVQKMAEACRSHKLAADLLSEGEAEVTWRVQMDGLVLQARTDWVNTKKGYILDVKTTEYLSDFARMAVNFGYHRQAAFYTALLAKLGMTNVDFYFLAVEKKEPFGTILFKADAEFLAKGYEENKADLAKLSTAYATGVWPNMPEEVVSLSLPAWYKTGGAS